MHHVCIIHCLFVVLFVVCVTRCTVRAVSLCVLCGGAFVGGAYHVYPHAPGDTPTYCIVFTQVKNERGVYFREKKIFKKAKRFGLVQTLPKSFSDFR